MSKATDELREFFYKEKGWLIKSAKVEGFPCLKAVNEELGLAVKWIHCSGNFRVPVAEIPHKIWPWRGCDRPKCGNSYGKSHYHYVIASRQSSGGWSEQYDWNTCADASDVPKQFQFHKGVAKSDVVNTKLGADPVFHEFGKKTFEVSKCWNGNVCVTTNQVIYEVQCKGVVTIENGKVSEDGITKPGAACWFSLDCCGKQGATFNIISDGKTWSPINRRTMKVTNSMTPKRSVDLSLMSTLDQKIILKVIEAYMKSLDS